MFFQNLFGRSQFSQSNAAPVVQQPVQMQLLTEEGLTSNGREAWKIEVRKGAKKYDFKAICIYNDIGGWRVADATVNMEEKLCKDITISRLFVYNGNICFFVKYTFSNRNKSALITCTREGNQLRFSKRDYADWDNRNLSRSCVVVGNRLYGLEGFNYIDLMTGEIERIPLYNEYGNSISTYGEGAYYYNGCLYTAVRYSYDDVYKLDLRNPDSAERSKVKNMSGDTRMYAPFEGSEDSVIYKNKLYSRKPGYIIFADLDTMGFYQQDEGIAFLGMASDRYLVVRDDTDTNQVLRGYSLYDLEESRRILFDKKRFQCPDPKNSEKKVMIAVRNVVHIGENVIFYYAKGKRVKETFCSVMPFDELKDGTASVADYEMDIVFG